MRLITPLPLLLLLPAVAAFSSSAWRVRAHAGTLSGWAWDLRQLRFLDADGQQWTPNAAIESGSYGGCVSCSYGANGCVFGVHGVCGVRSGNGIGNGRPVAGSRPLQVAHALGCKGARGENRVEIGGVFGELPY